MICVCAYCRHAYGVVAPLDDKRETHGICPDCYWRQTGKLHPTLRQGSGTVH